MKKLVFLFSVMLLVILVLMLLVNHDAFAQTATASPQISTPKKDHVVRLSG